MIRRRFRAPVRASGDGFVVDLGDDEAALVQRLVAELRQLLAEPDPGEEAAALLVRLFPVAHPDDPESEAEYQRLMREELVASKFAAFEIVDRTLAGDGRLDEGGLIAFMQSINSLRLALGTMLGVTDAPDAEVDPSREDSAEYHLYGYLSWLLEWSVRAIQSR
jgi:hypothetical protein